MAANCALVAHAGAVGHDGHRTRKGVIGDGLLEDAVDVGPRRIVVEQVPPARLTKRRLVATKAVHDCLPGSSRCEQLTESWRAGVMIDEDLAWVAKPRAVPPKRAGGRQLAYSTQDSNACCEAFTSHIARPRHALAVGAVVL